MNQVAVGCSCGWKGKRVPSNFCACYDEYCSCNPLGRCPKCGLQVMSLSLLREYEQHDDDVALSYLIVQVKEQGFQEDMLVKITKLELKESSSVEKLKQTIDAVPWNGGIMDCLQGNKIRHLFKRKTTKRQLTC